MPNAFCLELYIESAGVNKSPMFLGRGKILDVCLPLPS